ncbi:hypothetical protein GCM10007063_30200 [Lentibacillus kapialis]|uniref:Uncharacterized protein n=1 Tax=Lentibacillus kapialis TaxID=340214 RepID=A0A917V0W8_9BACI|nr:hypothetical protein GCM10007063_30200 [Lentibacillus kapialis]
MNKVESLRKNRQLVISYAFHQSGHKLVSHLYIADGKRAIMLYSCSVHYDDIKPIEISRANRYLHWQDILYFKETGYRVYDFLGLSIDEEDREQQNINKFKRGFGGREELNYNSYTAQTMKGKVMLLLLRWKWRNQPEIINRKAIIDL